MTADTVAGAAPVAGGRRPIRTGAAVLGVAAGLGLGPMASILVGYAGMGLLLHVVLFWPALMVCAPSTAR